MSMFTRLIVALCMTASAGLASASDAQIVQWPELIPTEGSGEVIDVPVGTEIIGMPTREEFAGTDEDWDYLLESYELQRYAQPQGAAIRADLDGQKVKIPGYVTPLGFGEEDVTEFLLVPYLGACIHVPPPPGNQIVYISNAAGLDQNRLFEPIWVTGTLKATSVGTALADVGYTIDGAVIEPYQ